MQGLIHINIAKTTQEVLIEQERFDSSSTGANSGDEIGNRDFERIGPQQGDVWW